MFGYPNITGDIFAGLYSPVNGAFRDADGSFRCVGDLSRTPFYRDNDTEAYGYMRVELNASRSNSNYITTGIVRPKSLTFNSMIKY